MYDDLKTLLWFLRRGPKFYATMIVLFLRKFRSVRDTPKVVEIEKDNCDRDGLGYLEGKSLDFINEKAYKGSATAHLEGGVPNLSITLKERSAHNLGQLFYFFERAVAMTGYLSGINPFDQPGVEFYKRNMFRLLNKPTQSER